MKLTYITTPEFEKRFKALLKRFRSLSDDFETVKRNAVELLHIHGQDNRSCVPLQGHENPSCVIYKIRKFACKALKGKGVRSGIRVIYAYHKAEARVVFIEIYYKQDQANEDKGLIADYVGSL